MGIIIIIIFGLFIGGMILAVKLTLKKIDSADTGITVDVSQIKTAQEFLPFDKIEDNMLDLGGFKYRKFIECTSINYHLKTEMEKDMIEASFARFLNSFQFPITIYIQTREMDLSTYLESLRESIDETTELFPQLKGYGETFYSEMSRLPELTGNSKQKKKYIIIGYDEAYKLENLNNEEKREYSINELNLRIQVLVDNLAGIGIKANELNTAGILELIYSTYHKDDYSSFENLLTGEYTSLITGMDMDRDENTGRIVPYVNNNALSSMSDMNRTTNALWSAKNVINNEVLSKDGLDEESQSLYQEVVDRLDEIVNEMKKLEIGGK